MNVSPRSSPIAPDGSAAKPSSFGSLLGLLSVSILFLLRASPALAGKVTYVPVSGDRDSGISPADTFTSAVSAAPGEHDVAGIKLFPLALSAPPRSASENDITVTATTGSLTLAPGPGSRAASGALGDVFSQALVNEGASDNSEEQIVLDPGSLQPGHTYHLRIYIAPSAGTGREINLSFAGDGKQMVETGFFDEEDATTSPARFADPNQAYFIDYRFKWDGKTAPGAIVTQRHGDAAFALYAVTNVEEEAAPAVVAVEPARPRREVVRREEELVAPLPAPAPIAEVAVQSEEFYADPALNAHGIWVDAGEYGTVWHPTDVEPDYRPYTRGSWAYSEDCGWTWVSDEDYGWATCHYGRWADVAETGWCWIPGTHWAPAWVTWRTGGDYCGWAPLSPDVGYDPGYGVAVSAGYDFGPGAYNFCHVSDLGAVALASALLPPQQNVHIYSSTTNVTNIVQNNTTVFNQGPRFSQVNQVIAARGARAVPQVAVRLRPDPVSVAATRAGLATGVVSLRAPRIASTTQPIAPPTIGKVIGTPVIDKGWAQVTDPKQKAQLQAQAARAAAAHGAAVPAPGAVNGPGVAQSSPGATAAAAPAPAKGAHPGTSPGPVGTAAATQPHITPGVAAAAAAAVTAVAIAPLRPGQPIAKSPAGRAPGAVSRVAVPGAAGAGGPPVAHVQQGARAANPPGAVAPAVAAPAKPTPPAGGQIAAHPPVAGSAAAPALPSAPSALRPGQAITAVPSKGRGNEAPTPAAGAARVAAATPGAASQHVRQGAHAAPLPTESLAAVPAKAKAPPVDLRAAGHAAPGVVAPPLAKPHANTAAAASQPARHSPASPLAAEPVRGQGSVASGVENRPPTAVALPKPAPASAAPQPIHHAAAPAAPPPVHHAPVPTPAAPPAPASHLAAPAPLPAHHTAAPAPAPASHSPIPAPQPAYHPAPAAAPAYHPPVSAPQPAYHPAAPAPAPAVHPPAPQPAYHPPAPAPQPAYRPPAPAPQPAYHPAPAPMPAARPAVAGPQPAQGKDEKKKKPQ